MISGYLTGAPLIREQCVYDAFVLRHSKVNEVISSLFVFSSLKLFDVLSTLIMYH